MMAYFELGQVLTLSDASTVQRHADQVFSSNQSYQLNTPETFLKFISRSLEEPPASSHLPAQSRRGKTFWRIVSLKDGRHIGNGWGKFEVLEGRTANGMARFRFWVVSCRAVCGEERELLGMLLASLNVLVVKSLIRLPPIFPTGNLRTPLFLYKAVVRDVGSIPGSPLRTFSKYHLPTGRSCGMTKVSDQL